MNFTPGPSPFRRDYAQEYAAAKLRASGLSTRSNRPRPQVPASQALPQSRATGPPAQASLAPAESAISRPSVHPHLQAPRLPDQPCPRPTHVAQRYVSKAEYTFADFERVPFSITDEIALHFNHAKWLTDPRNIREPWMTPFPRSRPAGVTLGANLVHTSARRPMPLPSMMPAAPLSQSGVGTRTTQPRCQPHAVRDIPGQVHSQQVPAQAQRQISIISISSSSDDDNQISSHAGNQDPDPAGEWLEPEESL